MTKLALMAVLVGMTACSDSSGPEATVEGTYTLRTVNGSALPFTIAESTGFKVEIVSDVFTLTAANTFSEVFTVRQTEGTTVTTETSNSSGTYTVTNGLVRMTDTAGDVLTASFSNGNTLTVPIGNFTLVFQK